MLAVETRQAQLPLGTVAVVRVQPGQLRDIKFGARAGRGQEGNTTVAQVEVIHLAEENIADAVGLKAVALVVSAQRTVEIQLHIVESEIAELPAQMQHRLPDVQRHGDTLNLQVGIRQRDLQAADLHNRAKGFPAGTDL